MDQPISVSPAVKAEDGRVVVNGMGIVFSLTPEAAADLGEHLLTSAIEAAGQRMMIERRPAPKGH